MPLRYRVLLLILSGFVLSGCASVLDHGQALATVPYMRQADDRVVIKVMVNGTGPWRFAIDTAASKSVIYEALRDELGLYVEAGRDVMVQGMVTSGVFPLIDIERVGIGTTDWTDVDLIVLPGDVSTAFTIDGILGLDFLRQYAIVFSTSDQLVHLFSPASVDADAYQGWISIRLDEHIVSGTGASLFFIDLAISTYEIPAVFDLGSGVNVLNWAAAGLLRLTPRKLRRKNADEITGALGSTPDVFRVGIDRVQTGAMVWRDEVFVIGDLPIFETIAADASKPSAILGAELFVDRDFVIDFAHSRLLINRKVN